MIVYKRRLLKKSSNRKSKCFLSTLLITWLANIKFHLRPIWLQILVAIDSESPLTSFPRFCAPPSEVTVLFYSNLSRRPFFGQVVDLDLLLALHRIQFGTCCFVPMSYFYSETNEWSQDWAKRWARLWSATTSSRFQWTFHFQWKKICRHGPISTKH